MAVQPFALQFPEKTAWVVGDVAVPKSPIRVGCLITIVVTPGMPLDAGRVDELCAAILKTFFDDGVRTVAIEDAEGPLTQSGILGPRSNALLKARKIRLVGVDRLGDIAEMRAIQTEAMQKAQQFQALFRTVNTAVADVAARLPPGPFADLFKLRLGKDDESTRMFAEVPRLFALERQFGRSLPADARRLLRGLELTEQVKGNSLAGELEELKRRMSERAQNGVLADDAPSRLPNPDAEPAEPIRLQTGTGMVALNGHQVGLLRRCAEMVEGVEKGMIPMSIYGLKAGQKQAKTGPAGSATDQFITKAVDQNQSVQHYIADTAEVLGIDLDDYPMLRRVMQQSQMMAGAAQDGVLAAYRQAFDKAWSHLESCVTPKERELLGSIGKARQLQRLSALEITPEEYSDLSAELAEYCLVDVLAEVAAAGVAVDAKVKVAAKEFDAVRVRLLRFYDLARQRGRQMASRTLEFAREDGGQALLVCLGFHQPTVQATWQAERVSHLVVIPDVTQ